MKWIINNLRLLIKVWSLNFQTEQTCLVGRSSPQRRGTVSQYLLPELSSLAFSLVRIHGGEDWTLTGDRWSGLQEERDSPEIAIIIQIWFSTHSLAPLFERRDGVDSLCNVIKSAFFQFPSWLCRKWRKIRTSQFQLWYLINLNPVP